MRNLRSLLSFAVAGALLFSGAAFAITTSSQPVTAATQSVYPCTPSKIGSTSTNTSKYRATTQYYSGTSGSSTDPCEPPCPPSSSTTVNQGDPSKVNKVDNPNVPRAEDKCCKDPVPLNKVEGSLGKTISFSASKPIDFVTVKSGSKAYVVRSSWSVFSGSITLSQAVSNYVIWVCP